VRYHNRKTVPGQAKSYVASTKLLYVGLTIFRYERMTLSRKNARQKNPQNIRLTGSALSLILAQWTMETLSEETMKPPIRLQDIRTLFRARDIVRQLDVGELDSAIEAARATIVATKGRRQYLQEILPVAIAHAVPGGTETFVVECTGEQRFQLQDGTLPLLWQLRALELENDTQAIKIIHYNGCGQREYWL